MKPYVTLESLHVYPSDQIIDGDLGVDLDSSNTDCGSLSASAYRIEI